ncbi:hypothetical protein PC129_g20879 [Phytophthora cactorum]|uniref:Uncharacterized protein n=1 Tax=Phytophthora cactorum TaxID=29920 RepID=A0A8T1H7X6_9STRA|nr:hypothetical protein Pcac1_g22244 [Phytophthora cactorum]KAG2827570.1 hypothetical protein PC113_g21604 [Phytophthora cactorum]KAG2876876.1 hypothetical protein PC114_g23959 [Phytophthora cactorum]KAG2893363.1 hypothetical protein PC117_g23790 [Phytophthora cactorum]KAG2967799.1 hypothetical protein PC118_g18372 [Phytophthora cactorum]
MFKHAALWDALNPSAWGVLTAAGIKFASQSSDLSPRTCLQAASGRIPVQTGIFRNPAGAKSRRGSASCGQAANFKAAKTRFGACLAPSKAGIGPLVPAGAMRGHHQRQM